MKLQKQFIWYFVLAVLLGCITAKSQYKVVNTLRNSTTVTLTLNYTGTDDYYIKESSPIIKTLTFYFHTHTFFDFSFKITDPSNKRFEWPQQGVFPIDPEGNFSFPIASSAVNFEYTESPFDFRIIRKQNGAVLFSTYNQQIIYSDHYLEIGTELDSDYVYGIG
jgi:alpha-glucosidase